MNQIHRNGSPRSIGRERPVIEMTAEQLRAALTEKLVADGTIASAAVEAAFRAVPRHLFTPGASLADAYAWNLVVAKKTNADGVTISSVSAPNIQAMMLEQAGLRPGMRVLEIGSGGYNAALMAEIVGPRGEVTTIDIDPEVTDRARTCLAMAGYPQVNVTLADGEDGLAGHGPYDRILVTVGAWDIPPAWLDQLNVDATITVPLRMRGLTRSLTLARDDGHLVAQSMQVCGFVAMQGAGAHQERQLSLLGTQICLRFDDSDTVKPEPLNEALETARVEAWTGVLVGPVEAFDSLDLWLATELDGFCLLSVDDDLDTGLVSPQNKRACPAAVVDGTLAYLALRKRDHDVFEFGAHAYGPDAAWLADALATLIRVWDGDHRHGPEPRIEVHPAGAPDDRLPIGRVIDKRHTRVTITWPVHELLATTSPAQRRRAPEPARRHSEDDSTR
jgi:protein-L-isoaspartate(D-aspartate) O-methyltransferase